MYFAEHCLIISLSACRPIVHNRRDRFARGHRCPSLKSK